MFKCDTCKNGLYATDREYFLNLLITKACTVQLFWDKSCKSVELTVSLQTDMTDIGSISANIFERYSWFFDFLLCQIQIQMKKTSLIIINTAGHVGYSGSIGCIHI